MNRRNLLKNIGAGCLLYPLMGALRGTAALADPLDQKRALFLYYPNGSIINAFFPDGNRKLPIITSPLEPFIDDISFIKGLEYKTTGSHEGGAQFCLTGRKDGNRYSIDSFLGDKIGQNTSIKALRLGVASNFQSGADKQISYLQSGAASLIQDNPQSIFYEIFGQNMASAEIQSSADGDRSLLDFAMAQIKQIQNKLGQLEKEKLDQHLTSLRELENSLSKKSQLKCSPSFDNRGIIFPESESSYPPTSHINDHFGKISEMMIDIMVEALHCGVTNVGLLQWSHAVSPTQFNFSGGLGLSSGHHDLSHYGGDENGEVAENFKKCQMWFKQQIANLFTKLQERKLGDKTLFESMAILATTDVADSNLHDFKNIPCFIAGNAGGALKQGQHLNLDRSYNDLLTTIVQAVDAGTETFGDQALGSGSMSELMKSISG